MNSFYSFQTLVVQVKCFAEIINIGYAVYRIHGLPWFRSLSWYFLITSNYFFYGENLMDYFAVVINQTVSKKICTYLFILFRLQIKYPRRYEYSSSRKFNLYVAISYEMISILILDESLYIKSIKETL